MVEILSAKRIISRTLASLFLRPGLVERRNARQDKNLTLTAAPAGFGITTLVVDWLKQIDLTKANRIYKCFLQLNPSQGN